MESDAIYMKRAIELAARGGSLVSPNPMVGAVVVKDNHIIAEGWHKIYGGPHAERVAIDSIEDKSLLHGATMYVTLEPCCHYGKTPPCADYIIENGISRVVVGTLDPNPKVAGGGINKLISAGVEVQFGVLKSECEYVCRFFMTVQKLHRPYVMLKWAETCDGFIGVNKISEVRENIWFTGENSRRIVHEMRSEYDAIMVGANTVRQDNPHLTVRYAEGKNPVRVVIDRYGKLDLNYHIFDSSAQTLVFTENTEIPYPSNVKRINIDFSELVLQQILDELLKLRIQSLMVEGGKYTLESFIQSNLYDEVNVFKSSKASNEIYKGAIYDNKVVAPRVLEDSRVKYYDGSL